MEMTKDAPIGGRRYQLGRLSAGTGSWLMMRLMERAMASASEGEETPPEKKPPPPPADVLTAVMVQSLLMGMTEDQLVQIQAKCLMCCAVYERPGQATQEVPMPLMSMDGRYSPPELQYDFLTVSAVTTQCLIFNLLPFFEARLAAGS